MLRAKAQHVLVRPYKSETRWRFELVSTTYNQGASEAGRDVGNRAADDLVRHFTHQIKAGALQEGQVLPPEREIVKSFGVSRTVVREAVLSLANKGLVEARPRFRPVVRKPNYDNAFEAVDSVVSRLLVQPDGIKNLYDTRVMTEASLVRQAAGEANKEDLRALRSALAENGAAIEDSERFYQTDIRFHTVLYEIPNNPILPAIFKAYAAWLSPQWTQMPHAPERNQTNFEAHSAIYEAILMRDQDLAEAALRRHLAEAWTQVEETFHDKR